MLAKTNKGFDGSIKPLEATGVSTRDWPWTAYQLGLLMYVERAIKPVERTGDEPFSSVEIVRSVAAHPRRSPFSSDMAASHAP